AFFVGQGVGIERSAQPCPGLARDPIEKPRLAQILDENRRNFLRPDLRDDPRHIPRRSLRIGRYALWRDEVHAIGVLEIAESIMVRDDLSTRGRNCGYSLPDLALERIELVQIGRRIGLVVRLPGGIDADQGITDIGHIGFRIGDGLPGMWIAIGMSMTMTMTMAMLAVALARLDTG